MKALYITIGFCSLTLFGDSIIGDNDFSPYASSESFITAFDLLRSTEDFLQPEPKNVLHHIGGCLYRLGSYMAFWHPLGDVSAVVQHEVFGHGYRLRTLSSQGYAINGYKIEMPQPYGPGNGQTYFSTPTNLTKITYLNSIDSAGIEANNVMASRLRLHYAKTGTIPGRFTNLYVANEFGFFKYVQSLYPTNMFGIKLMPPDDSHDIESYINTLNCLYPSDPIDADKLTRYSMLTFVDPFLLMHIWSLLQYIGTGEELEFPMIPLKGIRWLPCLMPNLTPFGPEILLENYFSTEKHRAFYAYGRYLNHAGNLLVGGGFEAPSLIVDEETEYGLRTDVWYQPNYSPMVGSFMNLYYTGPGVLIPDESSANAKPGNRISYQILLMASTPLFGTSQARLTLSAGYKSIGYLMGTPLNSAIIARGGIEFRF